MAEQQNLMFLRYIFLFFFFKIINFLMRIICIIHIFITRIQKLFAKSFIFQFPLGMDYTLYNKCYLTKWLITHSFCLH